MTTTSYTHDVLILGSGVAGWTAAIYATRAGLKTILLTGWQEGGQLMLTNTIDNFPGFEDGVDGKELMSKMQTQAEKYGTEVAYAKAESIEYKPQILITDDAEKIYKPKTLIIATGATAKWLNIPGEARYMNNGVSACATCDGPFFKDMNVAVIGGGNTAVEEALHLATLCSKVTIFCRSGKLKAEAILLEQLYKNPTIDVIYHTEVREIVGEGNLEAILVENNQNNERSQIPVRGVFVAIGHKPQSELFSELEKTEWGYLKTQNTQTNIENIFAAGDVQDPHYRQAITASASGCIAALKAADYINKKF